MDRKSLKCYAVTNTLQQGKQRGVWLSPWYQSDRRPETRCSSVCSEVHALTFISQMWPCSRSGLIKLTTSKEYDLVPFTALWRLLRRHGSRCAFSGETGSCNRSSSHKLCTNCKPHTLEEEVLFPNNARVGRVLKHAQNTATRWGWGPRPGSLDLRVWLQSTLTTWNNNSDGNSWEDHATSSVMYEIVCNVHTIRSMLLVLEVTFSPPPLDSWGSNDNLKKKSNLRRPRPNPRQVDPRAWTPC